jgi:hypothetical protein
MSDQPEKGVDFGPKFGSPYFILDQSFWEGFVSCTEIVGLFEVEGPTRGVAPSQDVLPLVDWNLSRIEFF